IFDTYKTKGELQALTLLREIGGCFISQKPILPNGDGKIDLQGYRKYTYYVIQIKFYKNQVSDYEEKKIDKFVQFLNVVNEDYPNVNAIFCNTFGIEIYKDYNKNNRVFFVDSIKEIIKLIKKEDIEKYLNDMNEKSIKLYPVNHEFKFPFELKENENEIGYLGIDFVRFYGSKHPISIRNESSIEKGNNDKLNNDKFKLLERYYQEFFDAISAYLQPDYLGIFIVYKSFYNDKNMDKYLHYALVDQEIILCTKANISEKVAKYFEYDSEFEIRYSMKRKFDKLENKNKELKNENDELKNKIEELKYERKKFKKKIDELENKRKKFKKKIVS
ncbi:23924_t:CDS:2, partial [Dentiscutata erythropus]